jgi:DNA polymerase-3 subunit delta'
MVFDHILGQKAAVSTLERALTKGRVHHAYRFEGPDGVGKELAALALAQSLQCTAGGVIGCGRCTACAKVVRFSEEEPRVPQHPDVVFIQRGLYPPALLGATHRESTGIGVEQIRRLVLSRAGYAPHEGRALVFIVRDAHELTPPAANALLKTLEEPGPRVHFVLLTSQPNRLLDTVRSRTLPVRFAPLADAHVASILENAGLPVEAAPLAEGSASAALALADPDRLRVREEFIASALAAVDGPHFAESIAFASSKPPDRDALKSQLFFLAQHLAHAAREHAHADASGATRLARRYRAVLEAMDHLEKNGQPAFVLESMISRMRAA